MLRIYNTLSKRLDDFEPYDKNNVGMYTCGPTVYDFTHIGHCRKYTLDDIIKRSLGYLGFKVRHVMNITDVGHLSSDQDDGEDKIEKGARKYGKTVWEVAEFFTRDFFDTMNNMNIVPADVICKATEHIAEQIEIIKSLFEKKLAYETSTAVYFDVSKFPTYTKLSGQDLSQKEVGVREEINVDPEKKNPADFVLWFKRTGRFKNHVMHWDSPWGDGFPGWHIECSAMSMKYLGDQFDIHTGGVDHISVHHTNEIAQSEGMSGKQPFVKYWIHHEHLLVNGEKMSKSTGNVFRLTDLEKLGYEALDLRYFFLTAKHRVPQNFTFDALESAKKSRKKLVRQVNQLSSVLSETKQTKEESESDNDFKTKFVSAIEDDFNIPIALSIVWEVLKSDLSPKSKLQTILEFDKVLGLNLDKCLNDPKTKSIPQKARELIEKRDIARKNKDWATADEIRQRLKAEFDIEVADHSVC
ncbi:cysteine--tRNA ligase [Candidatus Dojkabacteria bacterium]|uniref:Cysteine--tRNA ligase n=1 Tax=Candidatus Dojkabacteria bacterium TaxID=2099670 RepID=A0A3M0YZK5_9BACT|nr:MAG: cysteine--tRNA ligase [Candidatus Dojkabacteria bacterium]